MHNPADATPPAHAAATPPCIREDAFLEANFTIPNELADLARDAAWELDALARVLPDQVSRTSDGEHLVVRGICGRFLRLSSVIQSALDGDGKDGVDMDRLRNMVQLEGIGQG